jgi:hypothetical protein
VLTALASQVARHSAVHQALKLATTVLVQAMQHHVLEQLLQHQSSLATPCLILPASMASTTRKPVPVAVKVVVYVSLPLGINCIVLLVLLVIAAVLLWLCGNHRSK